MIRRPPRSTLFPTRRSSDLERAHPPGMSVLHSITPTKNGGAPTSSLPTYPSMPLFGSTVKIATEEELRSEEHTSELQSQSNLVCRLLLEKKKTTKHRHLPTP